jgi:carbonic anhydrase
MNKVLEGIETFRRNVYPEYEHKFRELATRQHPVAMLITCADSRVDPNLLLQCEPGDLFIVRNAGNIVPPYDGDVSGVAASVEYAVDVLRIRDVIVCGHSDCGAMRALLNPQAVVGRPAVARWIRNAEAARRVTEDERGTLSEWDQVRIAAQENVVAQLANLATYPCVAAALARGRMDLYGWYYDIGSGELSCLEPGTRSFRAFDGTLPSATARPYRHGGTTAA